MPELPEVVTVVNQLNEKIINKKVVSVKLYKEKLLKNSTVEQLENWFVNEKILSVKNKGKFIVFYFSNDKILISHLRMNGKYFFNNSSKKEPHNHLMIQFDDNTFLHYNDTRMFGTFHIKTTKDYLNTTPLSNVGPTPMEISEEELFNKLQKSKRSIKPTLLDQQIVSGLGNIYVDEVLFACSIHPLTKAFLINKNELKLIKKFATSILLKSIELGGSTINSYSSLNMQEGNFQNFLQVHTKKGFACSRCNNIIEKITVGGRGTYICSNCQNEKNKVNYKENLEEKAKQILESFANFNSSSKVAYNHSIEDQSYDLHGLDTQEAVAKIMSILKDLEHKSSVKIVTGNGSGELISELLSIIKEQDLKYKPCHNQPKSCYIIWKKF